MRSLEELLEEACAIYRAKASQVKSKRRSIECVLPRAYFVKNALVEGHHPKLIGNFINRDRTSIYTLSKIKLKDFLKKKEKVAMKKDIETVKSFYKSNGGRFDNPRPLMESKRDIEIFKIAFG